MREVQGKSIPQTYFEIHPLGLKTEDNVGCVSHANSELAAQNY